MNAEVFSNPSISFNAVAVLGPFPETGETWKS